MKTLDRINNRLDVAEEKINIFKRIETILN